MREMRKNWLGWLVGWTVVDILSINRIFYARHFFLVTFHLFNGRGLNASVKIKRTHTQIHTIPIRLLFCFFFLFFFFFLFLFLYSPFFIIKLNGDREKDGQIMNFKLVHVLVWAAQKYIKQQISLSRSLAPSLAHSFFLSVHALHTLLIDVFISFLSFSLALFFPIRPVIWIQLYFLYNFFYRHIHTHWHSKNHARKKNARKIFQFQMAKTIFVMKKKNM